MSDSVRQKLNFSSFDESTSESNTPEQGRHDKGGYTQPHYQTRSQLKVIETVEATLCANYLGAKDAAEIERELHERRMKELEDILEEEKKKDWIFDKKNLYK